MNRLPVFAHSGWGANVGRVILNSHRRRMRLRQFSGGAAAGLLHTMPVALLASRPVARIERASAGKSVIVVRSSPDLSGCCPYNYWQRSIGSRNDRALILQHIHQPRNISGRAAELVDAATC